MVDASTVEQKPAGTQGLSKLNRCWQTDCAKLHNNNKYSSFWLKASNSSISSVLRLKMPFMFAYNLKAFESILEPKKSAIVFFGSELYEEPTKGGRRSRERGTAEQATIRSG